MPQMKLSNVITKLNYSEALDKFSPDPWYMDTVTCPFGTKLSNFEDKTVTVPITDLRGQEDIARLDTTGFQTLEEASSLTPEVFLSSNDDLIKELYYPEVENILKKITNADHVILYDHTFRRHAPDRPESPKLREPVLRVHVDQTPKSAHDRIDYHVDEKYHNFKRFQLINLWRPIGNPVYDYPLALMDFQSVHLDKDLVPIELRYPAWLKDKETYGVKYSPNHRWYYWSHMKPSEALLFKCYDSSSLRLAQAINNDVPVDESLLQDVAGMAPHTAFFNEEDAALNIPRQSIEVRAIVLHM